MTRKWLLWLPFVLGFGLLGMFYLGLRNPTNTVIASHVVGQPLPEFVAPPALPGQPGTASTDFRDGKLRLLNVFASWCVPCVDEIPNLLRLKAQGVEIAGVAIHDSTPDLQQFLARNGNPYSRIGLDKSGQTQLDFGSSGVPETFVINGAGVVTYQHIGIVTDADIPKLRALLAEGAK